MKNLFETSHKIDIIPIDIDYEGMSKVLAQFVELYKVCENKEMLDNCVSSFFNRPLFIAKSHD
jgi:hypothetical protein